jgi:hypothetical protein
LGAEPLEEVGCRACAGLVPGLLLLTPARTAFLPLLAARACVLEWSVGPLPALIVQLRAAGATAGGGGGGGGSELEIRAPGQSSTCVWRTLWLSSTEAERALRALRRLGAPVPGPESRPQRAGAVARPASGKRGELLRAFGLSEQEPILASFTCLLDGSAPGKTFLTRHHLLFQVVSVLFVPSRRDFSLVR